MEDRIDQLNENIKALTRAVSGGSLGGDVSVEKTVNVHEPTAENTGDYFSTGKNAIQVDFEGEELHRMGFGFTAKTVNIRSNIPVYVAFANPQNDGNFIPLGTSDLPFTIGGPEGIDSAYLWIRPQDSTKTAKVKVLAYR